MNEAIKVTHNGVDITYDVAQNNWVFTLRGRERTVDSLAAAQAAIEKPVTAKTSEKFERVLAYNIRYGSVYEVMITSVITPRWNAVKPTEVWTSFVRGEGSSFTRPGTREKIPARNLYPVNAHNEAIIGRIRDIEAEVARLAKERDTMMESLQCYEIPEIE